MKNTKVWYITGASKGIGLALTNQLLKLGHQVAATSRDAKNLEHKVDEQYSASFLPLEVDLSDEISIKKSIQATIKQFKKIDVVVNNAGYGTGGALEELSQVEIQKSFEINFFAIIKVIQQALPHMRKEKSGHIINISSIAGFAPGTGWSVYGAAKAAINGLSEGLANELKPLGIHVSIISPGWFRTAFAKDESIELSENQIEDYKHVRDAHAKFKSTDGHQIGDPDQVAYALLKLIEDENPPVNLFLGSDAHERATAKIGTIMNSINEWKQVSYSTDFNIISE
ncbi:SDR family oxidoreductase [Fulvivirga sediminis]|uniref:SDR family oxidoreductase n=1 Tax=Fulvivirga sediminis TaxID=2803949 RepID=A0A937F556_9BACT|nr:SDR family oxidoreductase [Fulvivirga sediminis]MBL3655201.1 SDR family oxidoreductase [Fulvivirga sediminis]